MRKIKAYVCCKTLMACFCTGTLLAGSETSVEVESEEPYQKSDVSTEEKKEEKLERDKKLKTEEKLEKEEKIDVSSEKSNSVESEQERDFKIDPTLCTKEVLMTFFPSPIVKAVLVWHKVPEKQAEEIAKKLSQKDQEVVKAVESRASQMDPNPLSDLAQRDTAVKIFREVLFQVFGKTLKDHNVEIDDNQIQVILDDMQQIKGKLFVECIKKERS